MRPKAKIALFVVAKSVGHLNAAFGLARYLEYLGYSPLFLCQEAAAPAISYQGFRATVANWLDLIPLPVGVRRRTFYSNRRVAPLEEVKRLQTEVQEELLRLRRCKRSLLIEVGSFLQRYKPDCIFFDPFLLMYAPLFWSSQIPLVALSTKPYLSTNPSVPPYVISTCFPKTEAEEEYVRMRRRQVENEYREWEQFEKERFGVTKKEYLYEMASETSFDASQQMVERFVYFDNRFLSIPELILHAPEFDFSSKRPCNLSKLYAGPCIDFDRREIGRTKMEPPPTPYVLCVLSSVFHEESMLARSLLTQALVDASKQLREIRFIITTSGLIDPGKFLNLPNNCRIERQISTLDLMCDASIVICQSGANVTKEAIWHGKSLLVFPDRADQPGVAARILDAGVGRVGSLRNVSGQEIAADITEMLAEDNLARNCTQMKESVMKYNIGYIEHQITKCMLNSF